MKKAKDKETVRVQLEMPKKYYEELTALKRIHGCASYAEVIRRLLDGSLKL